MGVGVSNTAMASFAAMCGNELWNSARLKAYVDNGVAPTRFNVKCSGCDGLEHILPCENGDFELPANGYQLPELDPAPWYDPNVPESANFAGLLVTSATMSSPYARSSSANIGSGTTLGRLRKTGRTITIHGYLIGKTCCSTQYGLRWLTTALGDPECSDNDCGGCDFDFLDCCPQIGDGPDDCLTMSDGSIFVRPNPDDEYARASDFFKRMYGVGVVSGPDVISCRGSNCGCGCGQILEVEFVLQTSQAYLNSQGTEVLAKTTAPVAECDTTSVCSITWIKIADGEECPADDACDELDDCLEDPNCPLPALPPAPADTTPTDCGCESFSSVRTCSGASGKKEWGSATLDIVVEAGSKALRNLKIQIWQNPLGLDCSDTERFEDCGACSTLIISYVPAGGVLVFSGSRRKIEVTCNGRTRDATRSVFGGTGGTFEWPDLVCQGICACVTWDCVNTASDATVEIIRVDRDL